MHHLQVVHLRHIIFKIYRIVYSRLKYNFLFISNNLFTIIIERCVEQRQNPIKHSIIITQFILLNV